MMKHDSQHPEIITDGKAKPFKKSISLGSFGLGKIWRRRSVTITEYDPCYKVVYLGNVLTGIAKGETCVEKPLCSLWKNYTCNQKPDVHMKLTITQSGLKAFTKEHGLTEYWSHRITYCLASPQFPRIFCWVYRHEGRKLKQELRCHAVVCSKESVAKQIASQLQSRLAQALNEFKRDKISRQNARLSLANSVYENPSLPRRKILLSTGSHNYRPPLERSKSAPRLMAIEESLEEDEESADMPFRRCRAENRLRTGTLRNRLGGLHGLKESAMTDIESRLAVTQLVEEDPIDEKTTVAPEPLPVPIAINDCCEPELPLYRDIVSNPENLLVCSNLPKYNEVIVDCPQGPDDMCYKYNSLVRDRKKLFEGISGGQYDVRSKRHSADSETLRLYHNLVKNRKMMFEGCQDYCDEEEEEEDCCGEDKDCGYPDDESTPSLQSISSGGSDVSSIKKRTVDLDSLSEEDSDESGYVEAPPSCSSHEDKQKDGSHKRIVTNRTLTTRKTHCISL
ncbi:uncharacterized protein LOC126905800 isoform X4 [Daktulosphaira vitifoliae]|nr:uncharacterized protein LOC126905800 isoform X4 [Daktulosphaira vitifoliae]